MARDQELSVKITGDASDLTKAADQASKALGDLQKDIGKVDAEHIEITPELELSRIKRDKASLESELRRLDRLRVDPEANLDITQVLRDERKLKSELDRLDARKVEIEAGLDVSGTGGLSQFSTALADVRAGFDSGGGGLLAGLSAGRAGMAAMGAEGAAAATGVGALALAATAAGKAAWGLGQQAADAQTSIIQLDALTQGLGEQTFGDLQKWAAATPFAIEDAIDATKRLVAAGTPLKELPDYLDDLGNVAAATGVPLEQIATVFAQMQSNGRASYEDLKQFADAGIPVFQVLADKLGLSVAEVQKMATEGKLGADSIELLRESLAQLYPDAMQRQADSFNGQMSTLQDTLDQTGQSLGQLFLPAMTELVGLFNSLLGPVLAGAQALSEFDDKVKSISGGSGLFDIGMNVATFGLWGGVKQLNGALGDTEQESHDAGASIEDLVAQVQAGMDASTNSVEALNKALKSAIEGFGEAGGEVRTKVSFIISEADLEDEIDKAVKDGVELPAKLNIKSIGNLGDKQEELLNTISSSVESGLQEGARRAQLNPNFDAAAWYAQVREKTRGQLIQVGVDPSEVNRVLTNIFGLPRTAKATAVIDLKGAQQDLNNFGAQDKKVPITPYINKQAADAAKGNLLLDLLKPKQAPIEPTPVSSDVASTKSVLSDVAKPGGKAREATIHPVLDLFALMNVRHTLDSLAQDRYSTIYVNTVRTGGGSGGGSGSIVPQLLGGPEQQAGLMAAGRALAAPSATTTVMGPGVSPFGVATAQQTSVEHVRLAPKQVPIKIYLDGAEIADHLELRTGRMAQSTSLRRRP